MNANMHGKIRLAALVLIALVATGGFAYWRYFVQARPAECGFCHRHINAKAEVVAEVNGQRRRTCCAHCAISEARQEHASLKLISVTDYYANRRIDPQSASYVEGSRVIACEHDMAPMDGSKHADMAMDYDRCAPGAFAFASRADAERFVAENGGSIRTLPEMLKEGGLQ